MNRSMNPVLVVCEASEDLLPVYFGLLGSIDSVKSLPGLQLLLLRQKACSIRRVGETKVDKDGA